jgi:hypothetical protein
MEREDKISAIWSMSDPARWSDIVSTKSKNMVGRKIDKKRNKAGGGTDAIPTLFDQF